MPQDVCAYVKCVKNIKRIRVGEGVELFIVLWVERALNSVCKYVKIRGQLIYVQYLHQSL